MDPVRSYVRALLREVTELPEEYFSEIDNAIMSSAFWEQPNDDIASDTKTLAAVALEDALTAVFEKLNLDMDVIVDSYFTSEPDYMLHPDHEAYPNRWIIDASWYVSKKNPGRNTIDIMIMTSDLDAGFDAEDVDPAALTRHIGQTIRHELVHYNQMKKQGASKGLDDAAAFEEMLNDPSQIPPGEDTSDPEWQRNYLRSHIEVDAHAHDAAEELLSVYDDEEIKDILRGKGDMTDPKMPNAIQHYFKILGTSDPAMRKFLGKTYTQVEKMRRIYRKDEGKKRGIVQSEARLLRKWIRISLSECVE